MAALLLTSTSHRFSLNNPSYSFSTPPKLKPSSCPNSIINLSSKPIQALLSSLAMQAVVAVPAKEFPVGIDVTTVDEYASQTKLLQDFTNVPSINKAWIFKSDTENTSRAMFSISQPNLLADKKRTFIHYSHISKTNDQSANFQWSPFPIEMNGVSTIIPSPSGSKLLVVRNKESESPTQLEIWGPYQLEKEIQIPQSTHGPIYTDGWFEGISWNHEENLIAYVAEEPAPVSPVFNDLGYKKDGSTDKDCGSWKGQGDWEEDWGETYSKKRKPSLFVVHISSGEVVAVEGIPKSLSVGQVVWAPSTSDGCYKYLVFVGWLAENGPQQTPRKLGIKYCYNRPCTLYAVEAPFQASNTDRTQSNAEEAKDHATAVKLTHTLSSAFFPRFSMLWFKSRSIFEIPELYKTAVCDLSDPVIDRGKQNIKHITREKKVEKDFIDHRYSLKGNLNDFPRSVKWVGYCSGHGKALTPTRLTNGPDGRTLVFLSARSSVDSGAHSATDSLHKMAWPADGKPDPSITITDVVPVVMCPEDGCFPGLYCSSFLAHPWLSDGCTMILSSVWGSIQVILSVNILSCKISRISPNDTIYSWNVLALDEDNILAVSSSPLDPPQIKYGFYICTTEQSTKWDWTDVSSLLQGYSIKVRSLLSSHQCSILKIPVSNSSENLAEGAKKPFEAIFVSQSITKSEESRKDNQSESGSCNPLIVILHGGPHSVSLTNYSKSLAFLSSLGYNLLIVNYRGSLGFGEEALQSLPGRVGSQDVRDVLAALDYVSEKGLVDASKVAVLGGSHGGFLTTHLIGQAPDKFVVAAVRNPVCNLSLMVGTTDIPDWCYVEACGKEGKNYFSEAPSTEHLSLFYSKSPIAHLSKVKVPVLFLLGAQDLRVPVSNGLQYARALREKGVEVKVIMFPDDVHGIERPRSDFESFLNIGVWFKKYCK